VYAADLRTRRIDDEIVMELGELPEEVYGINAQTAEDGVHDGSVERDPHLQKTLSASDHPGTEVEFIWLGSLQGSAAVMATPTIRLSKLETIHSVLSS
jgi:hypothetical protein